MGNITVYYAKVNSCDTVSNYSSQLLRLPAFLREKIIRLKNNQSQVTKLFGLLLLQKALEQNGHSKSELSKIEYGEQGKPLIKDAIDFNISHSQGLVVCACNAASIGIDVEEIRSINISNFIPYLSFTEFSVLQKSERPQEDFFELWTKKEAFVKAIGDGMTIPFPEIEIDENKIEYMHQSWFTKKLTIDSNYIVHICTEKQVGSIDIKRIDF